MASPTRPAAMPRRVATGQAGSRVTGHVLVVDDDPELLEVLAMVLDLADFEVSTAGDGEAALAAVVTGRPDVVVCDVGMPGIDGLEVCRRLKSTAPTAPIPVILLTAHGRPADRAAGESAGCDAYLVKPFSPQQLIDVIRDLAAAGTSPD